MKSRSLWPREHGAYVQLLVPLVAALAIAPSVAGALLAVAASAAFLAHEPVLVMLGHRGRRLAEQLAARARSRLVVLTCLALISAGVGLGLAPSTLPFAAVAAVAGGIVLVLSWREAGHSLGGEIVAAAALAAAAAPVAVAGGLATQPTLALWAMWSLAFASTVVAVHVVIASHKGRATRARWAVWIALLALTGVGIAVGRAGAILWCAAVVVTVWRPPATQLRRIGVVLAIAASASALVAIVVR